MRLHMKIKPMKFMKALSIVLATWTMCVSPLAQGAEAANAQKQAINDFIKETGLTKKMTVGEYWQGVRQVYPLALRTQLDHWVALNHNEMMPSVEASTFKDAQGKEQYRVSLTKDGEVATLTFAGDKYSVNGVSFSRSEIAGYKSFDQMAEKIANNDALVKKDLAKASTTELGKDFILSYKEFQRLTARQKAEYFVRLRMAMEAAQKVYTVFNGTQAMNDFNKAHEWAYQFLFGQDAEAAGGLAGQPCVVAGYLSVYGENNSCGGAKQGAADLAQKMSANSASCSGGGVACNPMVYGFDPGNGDAPFCIARSEIKYATSICNKRSPIDTPQDKAKIIESYLRKVPDKNGKTQNIKLVLDDKGQVSPDQYKQISGYFDDLKGFVNSAINKCDTAPLQEIQKRRDDQQSACDNIRVRAFSLQAFVAAPQPTVALLPPPAPQPKACEAPKIDDGKGGCTCPDNTHPAGGGGGGHHAKAAPPADDSTAASGTLGAPPMPNQADSDSGKCVPDKKAVLAGAKVTPPAQSSWWDNNKVWILALGAAIIGGGIYWWWKNRHNSSSSTTTVTGPVQVMPTTPYPPPTTTTVTPVTTTTGSSGGTTTTTTTPVTTTTTSEGGTGSTTAVSGGISRQQVSPQSQ